jgi:carotenoid cleavage dioxygenase-like enzyme
MPRNNISRRDALRYAFYASAVHFPAWSAGCSMREASENSAADWGLGAGLGDDDPIPITPFDPQVSWYLQNEYAPVHEERDVFELKVVGAIPPELDGVFLRNGPNMKGRDLGHKFCGHGMVHAVAFRDGNALWYRNRYVRTLFYDNPDTVSVDPEGGPANTSVIYHASRLLAVAELGFPYQLSSTDLSTVGAHNFAGKLADSFTGHPKVDPVTGEMLAYGYPFAPPFLRYYRIDAQGNMVSNEPIDLPRRRDGLGSKLCMIHDFAITATKTIFMQLPVVFDLDRALQGSNLPFGWDESNGAHLGVLPRAGGSSDVTWIEIDPCYIFHVVNAYDDGPNRVILDVMRHAPPFWAGDNTGLLPGAAQLARYTIDLTTRTAKLNILDDRTVEFPRIDDRATGNKHRFAYTLAFDHTKMFEGHVTGIVKYDLAQGVASQYTTAPGLHLDEPTFVPAGPGQDEGYLLAFVYRRQTNTSAVLILDASDLGAQPIATVELPVRVPIGLHSYWLPSSVSAAG